MFRDCDWKYAALVFQNEPSEQHRGNFQLCSSLVPENQRCSGKLLFSSRSLSVVDVVNSKMEFRTLFYIPFKIWNEWCIKWHKQNGSDGAYTEQILLLETLILFSRLSTAISTIYLYWVITSVTSKYSKLGLLYWKIWNKISIAPS